jgi:hypothetical protein
MENGMAGTIKDEAKGKTTTPRIFCSIITLSSLGRDHGSVPTDE